MVVYRPVSELPVPIKAYGTVKRLLVCIATFLVVVYLSSQLLPDEEW